MSATTLLQQLGGLDKQAGVRDEFVRQLPRITAKDTAIGAALGLSAGGAKYLYHKATDDKQTAKSRSLLTHLLGGAAIGAAGNNLVMDRVRRYVSNTVLPFGYGTVDNVSQLTPSLRKVWEGAVLDQPTQELETLRKSIPVSELTPADSAARYELFRRSLGLPVAAEQAYFQETGVKPYAPHSEAYGVPLASARHIEFSPAGWSAYTAQLPDATKRIGYAAEHLQRSGKPATEMTSPLADLFAKHETKTLPAAGGKQVELRDLWDFALTPTEERAIPSRMWAAATGRGQERVPLKEWQDNTAAERYGDFSFTQDTGELRRAGSRVPVSPTHMQHLKTLVQRKVLNDVLLPDGGVVYEQAFHATPGKHQTAPKVTPQFRK